MALAVIGCAAAVFVVPEVRCAMGLDAPAECTDVLGAKPLLPTPSLMAASTLKPVQDPRISRIKDRYDWVEANQHRFLFKDVPLSWAGADSATATVYVADHEIPKIRVRIYSGPERNSLLFYYTGARLNFVHQVNTALPTGVRYEQRFWFHGEGLIRWRGPGNGLVAESAPEFAQNSAYLTQLAPHLMNVARQALAD
jgi:hypothetical protein